MWIISAGEVEVDETGADEAGIQGPPLWGLAAVRSTSDSPNIISFHPRADTIGPHCCEVRF